MSLTLLLRRAFRVRCGYMAGGGGGTWVFFGWVFAARESKLAPRYTKKLPSNI